jgi:diacylglycerol kinase family enzyme
MRLSKRGRDLKAGEFISYWQVSWVEFRPDRPMPLNLDGEPLFARVRL